VLIAKNPESPQQQPQ
jgi:hypothetical protein